MSILQIRRKICFLIAFLCFVSCSEKEKNERDFIAAEIEKSMTTELLDKWYPAAIDKEFGGFLSAFTFDFKPTGEQDKMIVSQARHVWTSSKAAEVYTSNPDYKTSADHGFKFLSDVMWDKTYGGL